MIVKRFDINSLDKGAHVHFIGIGGISMSGIAQIFIKNGFKVSGSDRCESNITKELVKLGAEICFEHIAENVHGADLVVHTAAVHDDNPEMQESRKLGIKLIDRAECLGAIMKKYVNRVGVAGTHGKTTTTGMLTHALIYSELDPTVSIGGELDIINGNIKTGSEEYFVTEACEYTNSFLKFFPTVSLITNIEADHLDFFKDLDDILNSFRKFAELPGEEGCVIAWGEDDNIKKMLDGFNGNVITYGIENCDYTAKNIEYVSGYPQFDCVCGGEKITHIKLNVPGKHNILNALAVIAVCKVLGADINKVAEGIESFKGTHRRFEKKGMCKGAVVIDDYAHHPTEIKATLTAANQIPHKKIRCIFQPHTYSRTRTLWNDFVSAFDGIDELILTDIYAARELPDGITTSERLAGAISETGLNTTYIKEFNEIADYVRKTAEDGDIIFTMGAGTVTEIGPLLCE